MAVPADGGGLDHPMVGRRSDCRCCWWPRVRSTSLPHNTPATSSHHLRPAAHHPPQIAPCFRKIAAPQPHLGEGDREQ